MSDYVRSEEMPQTSEGLVGGVAVAAVAATLQKSKRSPEWQKKQAKKTLIEGVPLANTWLEEAGFCLSPTEPNTPADGNWGVHGLHNQMQYSNFAFAKSPQQLRTNDDGKYNNDRENNLATL